MSSSGSPERRTLSIPDSRLSSPSVLSSGLFLRDLVIAVRADNQHAAALQFLAQKFEQRQRRRVGPMQIVDHEHERRLLGSFDEESADRIERAETRLGRLRDHAPRRRRLFSTRRELRDDACDVVQSGAHHHANFVRRRRVHVFAQYLHPRPVGRRARLLVAASPEHQCASILRGAREHFGTPRFADPGSPSSVTTCRRPPSIRSNASRNRRNSLARPTKVRSARWGASEMTAGVIADTYYRTDDEAPSSEMVSVASTRDNRDNRAGPLDARWPRSGILDACCENCRPRL